MTNKIESLFSISQKMRDRLNDAWNVIVSLSDLTELMHLSTASKGLRAIVINHIGRVSFLQLYQSRSIRQLQNAVDYVKKEKWTYDQYLVCRAYTTMCVNTDFVQIKRMHPGVFREWAKLILYLRGTACTDIALFLKIPSRLLRTVKWSRCLADHEFHRLVLVYDFVKRLGFTGVYHINPAIKFQEHHWYAGTNEIKVLLGPGLYRGFAPIPAVYSCLVAGVPNDGMSRSSVWRYVVAVLGESEKRFYIVGDDILEIFPRDPFAMKVRDIMRFIPPRD